MDGVDRDQGILSFESTLASIKELVGRYAYFPEEAANGVTLHLKAATLTGTMTYFFDEPPMKGNSGD